MDEQEAPVVAEAAEAVKSGKAGAALKALLLLGFILGSIAIFHYTPLGERLNPETIEALVGRAGSWGPAIFIAIYALGVCLFLPASFFTSIGAVIFGPYLGYLCNLSGALIGSTAAFLISRYLGRDFIARLLGHRLQKYDHKIARNGFATTLYLRLIYFPFTPLNFGLGLTKISFKDYFFGTMLGIFSGGFVLTFFFATLGAAWKAGNWGVLLSWRAAVAATLFCVSFTIPALVKKSRLFKEQATDA